MRASVSSFSSSFALSLVCLGLGTASAHAGDRRALPTHMAAPASEPAVAALAAAQTIHFGVTLPLRNQAALEALLKDQKDPGSPHYRQYLSVPQFAAQYSPTQADYDRVVAYARAQGLTVTRTYANRLLVDLSGPSAAVNKAFAVTMQLHKQPATAGKAARSYYAPDIEPSLSPSLPILTVIGLSNRELPQSMLVRSNKVIASTTGSGTQGQFLGSDIRAAYTAGSPLAGAGQTVGLIELGPYNLSDVQAYFSTVKQPLNVPIYNVLLGGVDGVCAGTPSTGGCDDGEEVIDMQQAISMAPALSGLIIYETYNTGDFLSPFAQAASDDIAKQLSLSFGFGGTPAQNADYEQVFLELSAQGQNLFIASGDGGAFPDGGGYPGNSPNVTDVGGTDLVTAGAGGPWQSETAWIGSGGGYNPASPIPAYQVPVINSANGGSPNFRNVPDVSMEANTDNYFCANGACSPGIGGTSLAAPRWAGFLALINEQANGQSLGFFNNLVYALGQTSGYTAAFHDIVVGNNFNAGSPDLFQAVPGYDLTSGLGTPNGAGFIDALAPAASAAAAPNFTLTASTTNFPLKPGGSATTTITVLRVNGFSETVDLAALPVGTPAGVTATLGAATLAGSSSTDLVITTTAATPGGSFLVAVTGTGGGLSHTAYVSLALPDFSIQAASSMVYLNQNGNAFDTLTVNAINKFAGAVTLSVAALPTGLSGTLSPIVTSTTSVGTLQAGVLAPTSSGTQLSVSGTYGATTRTVPALAVAISAAAGDCGLGTLVNLQSAFNRTAVHTDSKSYTDVGADGGGYSFSANLLGPARTWDGLHFVFGQPDQPNAVSAVGQTIALPAGSYNQLQLIGNGFGGAQLGQALTVTYADGTTSTFTQTFSDWFAPASNVNEGEAVAMAYRNESTGAKDARQFNLYGYTFQLNAGKTVKSLTLPNNSNVLILAATLSNTDYGRKVNLASQFNATGIYTDGSVFDPAGGLDGGGAAYSANLLQDPKAGGESVVVGSSSFHIAAANAPNAVYAAGQTIPLPFGLFQTLKLLGTGVQGNQLNQPVQLNFTDGTSMTVNQNFSDWSAPGGFANESRAIQTAYRDYNDGSQDQQAFNVYLYTFSVPLTKFVKSITLPNNRDVLFLSITLAPPSIVELESILCPYLEGSNPLTK